MNHPIIQITVPLASLSILHNSTHNHWELILSLKPASTYIIANGTKRQMQSLLSKAKTILQTEPSIKNTILNAVWNVAPSHLNPH